MSLEQKLSLKLAQRLVMTPSLQQAIKLLQMTRMELQGVISQEMVENPLLEELEPITEDEPPAEETRETEAFDEIDLEAYFKDYADSWEGSGYSSMNEERQGPPIENTLSRDPDLYDHLLWQLQMADLEGRLREIAEVVVGNLNPDGFLVASIPELQRLGLDPDLFDASSDPGSDAGPDETRGVGGEGESDEASESDASSESLPAEGDARSEGGDAAEASPDGADEDDEVEDEVVVGGYDRVEVEKALDLVRNLDPPGVGWWTLREALVSQLRRTGFDDDALAVQILEDHWDLFRRRKFELIARELGLPLGELEPAVDQIKTLETRPGREFNTERTHYVEPDVHVVRVDDEYVIQLNDDGMPKLRVSRAYRRLFQAMKAEGGQKEARQYIQEKMRSALWLIKSLDQRQRTIYKVARSIVDQQKSFLDYGIDHLRPMVLRDVAEDIGMHESTVSRVVSNKYIHTPRGLFPMKFFFHSGIDRQYGGDISSLTVKRKIENLIDEEDPKKPLSDSALMKALRREGIKIARRTVAKYRDELNIPSSTERKKIF